MGCLGYRHAPYICGQEVAFRAYLLLMRMSRCSYAVRQHMMCCRGEGGVYTYMMHMAKRVLP